MTDDNPQALLAGSEICVLATVNPNGSVHAMPMWYLYEDEVFMFMTGADTQKYKNVVRTGQATITVDRRTPPYYAVMVYGNAEVGSGLDEGQRFRTAARYLGEAGAKAYLAKTPVSNGSIYVRARKIVEFHGNAGR